MDCGEGPTKAGKARACTGSVTFRRGTYPGGWSERRWMEQQSNTEYVSLAYGPFRGGALGLTERGIDRGRCLLYGSCVRRTFAFYINF